MALKHARPGEVVSLRAPGQPRTAAIVRTSAFEAVRLVLPAGTKLPPHSVPGFITLLCLEGHVRLGTSGAVLDLRAGDWVFLEGGEKHWVEGVEPAALLLTILFDGAAARDAGPGGIEG